MRFREKCDTILTEVIAMAVGDRIKERRKALGMSAEVLAERVGLSPATIYRYESGDIRSVKLSALRPIAEALGMDLYDLLEGDRPVPKDLIPLLCSAVQTYGGLAFVLAVATAF